MDRLLAYGTSRPSAFLAVALGAMALEYLMGLLLRHETHEWRETAASFGVALGRSLTRGLEAALAVGPAGYLYAHRLFRFDPLTAPALLGLLLATEFVYYWHHRASHRIRWMWATHAVHHSATRLNLTAAIRLGWTGAFSGSALFFLPLIWLGFHPVTLAAMFGLNLAYQLFIHTELIGRLGPFEWVFNTPQHHRVHHAANAACLDRNYGGMLIIYDRLFGTLAAPPKDEKLRYGLVGGIESHNPIRIALGEWGTMLKDARQAGSWRRRLQLLFGAPGAAEPVP